MLQSWLKRCQKCIDHLGDYSEGLGCPVIRILFVVVLKGGGGNYFGTALVQPIYWLCKVYQP